MSDLLFLALALIIIYVIGLNFHPSLIPTRFFIFNTSALAQLDVSGKDPRLGSHLKSSMNKTASIAAVLTRHKTHGILTAFPSSIAATVNLSWLCNLDSLLSGRRYLDSYLELLLSILPTFSILVYSSASIMKVFPESVKVLLEYVTIVNWLLLTFYSWEITKTMAALAASSSNKAAISGRRHYTSLYVCFFASPLLILLLRRIASFELSGRWALLILALKPFYLYDDIDFAVRDFFTRIIPSLSNINLTLVFSSSEPCKIPSKHLLLPPEIIAFIHDFLKDSRQNRRVCKLWRDALTPIAFRRIDFKKEVCLRNLINNYTAIQAHGCSILSFAITVDQKIAREFITDDFFLELAAMMPHLKQLNISALPHLSYKTLIKLPKLLKSVRHLILATNSSSRSFQVVKSSFAYPYLKSLNFSGNDLQVPEPLAQLPVSQTSLIACFSNLELEKLLLDKCVNFELFFKHISAGNLFSSLKTLSLKSCKLGGFQLFQLLSTLNWDSGIQELLLERSPDLKECCVFIRDRGLIAKEKPANIGNGFRRLDISFTDINDARIETLVGALPMIQTMIMRGCIKISEVGACRALDLPELTVIDLTDCTGAVRTPELAYFSVPVRPPAIAFSARFESDYTIRKARAILMQQA